MKTTVIISIVIANFNGEKYLDDCLRSIFKSTLLNFEVIIVDDGSIDNSNKILQKYEKKERVKIYYFEINRGAAYARNFGVKQSKGKYILFIDFDCEIEKNCLKEIINKFDNSKKIGGIILKLITDNGKLDNAGHFYSIFGFPYEIGSGENPVNYQKEMSVFGAKTSGLAVRKELIKKVGGFDEDYLISGEDTDFSWRIGMTGYGLIYLPTAIGNHHQKKIKNKSVNYRILYEGLKNNLSNIIKNSPIHVILWMIPIHFLSLMILSFKLIGQRRVDDSLLVYKSILWNIIHLDKTLMKRKLNKVYIKNSMAKIMFRPINYLELMKKGWRWFLNV